MSVCVCACVRVCVCVCRGGQRAMFPFTKTVPSLPPIACNIKDTIVYITCYDEERKKLLTKWVHIIVLRMTRLQ